MVWRASPRRSRALAVPRQAGHRGDLRAPAGVAVAQRLCPRAHASPRRRQRRAGGTATELLGRPGGDDVRHDRHLDAEFLARPDHDRPFPPASLIAPNPRLPPARPRIRPRRGATGGLRSLPLLLGAIKLFVDLPYAGPAPRVRSPGAGRSRRPRSLRRRGPGHTTAIRAPRHAAPPAAPSLI